MAPLYVDPRQYGRWVYFMLKTRLVVTCLMIYRRPARPPRRVQLADLLPCYAIQIQFTIDPFCAYIPPTFLALIYFFSFEAIANFFANNLMGYLNNYLNFSDFDNN